MRPQLMTAMSMATSLTLMARYCQAFHVSEVVRLSFIRSRRCFAISKYPTIRASVLSSSVKSIQMRSPSLVTRFGHISTASEGQPDEKPAPEVEPTWTYTPYQPPPTPKKGRNNLSRPGTSSRRYFSSKDEWKVPNKVTIPEGELEMTFTRSSGAGGQNVNKVNTQVMIKFHVMDAQWIPREVRERIQKNEANRINKEGFMTITSQEYRTQSQNRKDAIEKLQEIVLKSYPRPKVRKVRRGISKRAKEINKENKRHKSQVKANRKRIQF